MKANSAATKQAQEPKTVDDVLAEFFKQLSQVAIGAIDLNQFRRNMYTAQAMLSADQLEELEHKIDLFSSRLRSAVPEAVSRAWQNRRAILSAYNTNSAPTT